MRVAASKGWIKALKAKILTKSNIEKKIDGVAVHDFLTVGEASARLGIGVRTLYDWIRSGVIPRPRKFGYASKRPIRREYVENLLDQLIIRNSTVWMSDLKAFRRSCWRRLFGVR